MLSIITIIFVIITQILILYTRNLLKQKYQIIKYLTRSQKVEQLVKKINDQQYKIPLRPQSIQPPKPVYTETNFIYEEDENDSFDYYTLEPTKFQKTEAVVIICFLGGHSKSQCIRRKASAFSEKGYRVYIIQPRGALNKKINPLQKRFISRFNADDLSAILGHIKEDKVILAAYSIGCFITYKLIVNKMQQYTKITKIVMGFVEFDVNYTVTCSKKLQQLLGQPIAQLIKNNIQYYLNQDISKDKINQFLKFHTPYTFDKYIELPLTTYKSIEEYYQLGDLSNGLQYLQVPTLIIQTNDDIVTGKYYPEKQIKDNQKNIDFILINKGNHLGTVLSNGTDLVSKIATEWCEL